MKNNCVVNNNNLIPNEIDQIIEFDISDDNTDNIIAENDEFNNKQNIYSEINYNQNKKSDIRVGILISLMVLMLILFLGVRYFARKSDSNVIIYKSLTYASTELEQTKTELNESSVNINTATLEQLCELPGIGEVRAKAIIAYREKNGEFASTESIMNVSGIAEGIYNKIKKYITI